MGTEVIFGKILLHGGKNFYCRVVGANFSRIVLENEIANNILEAMSNKERIRPTDSSQSELSLIFYLKR